MPPKSASSQRMKQTREANKRGNSPVISPKETMEEKILKREKAAELRLLEQEGPTTCHERRI